MTLPGQGVSQPPTTHSKRSRSRGNTRLRHVLQHGVWGLWMRPRERYPEFGLAFQLLSQDHLSAFIKAAGPMVFRPAEVDFLQSRHDDHCICQDQRGVFGEGVTRASACGIGENAPETC